MMFSETCKSVVPERRRADLSWFNRWFAQIGVGLVLLISFLWAPAGFPHVEICPFRHFTGLPCPGCGLTRAFCAISHGQFGAAFDFNPFGFVFYAMALSVLLWPFLQRKFPAASRRVNLSRILVFAIPLLVLFMFIYGIARIVFLLS